MIAPAALDEPQPVGTAPALRWTWARFDALSVDDLYDLLALRAEVFVVEQHCVYLDPDGVDRRCAHLLGRDAGGRLVASLRVVDAGVKYAEPSIGRVVTAPSARGGGAGHRLLAEGLARCAAAWPGRAIRISAQAHLAPFYAAWGFAAVGDDYDEDGIPHREMIRAADPPIARALDPLIDAADDRMVVAAPLTAGRANRPPRKTTRHLEETR